MSVLLKKSGLFTEYSDIKDICKPLEQKGIIGFIYMRHFPDGSFIDFSNQLPWSQYFLERYYSNQYDTDAINDHMFISGVCQHSCRLNHSSRFQ